MIDEQSPEQHLAHLQGDEERTLGLRALQWAEQAQSTEQSIATPFLEPDDYDVVTSVLRRISAVAFRGFGGYEKARRRRLLVYPHYAMVAQMAEPIGVVDVTAADDALGEGMGDDVRVFTDALSRLGIGEDERGDVLPTGGGAQIVLSPEAAVKAAEKLIDVAGVFVQTTVIDPEQMEGAYDRVKQMRATVASLRIDAVASVGFGDSRTKITGHVKNGRVKLNWIEVKDGARPVKEGDVISMRGRGRVLLTEVGGKTRKGRIGITVERYY